MKQELLTGALLAVLMTIPVIVFAEDVQFSPDQQLAQNQVQAPTTTTNNASDHSLIQGTSANGRKEITIIDENGNLKVVEKNALPASSSAHPAATGPVNQPMPMSPTNAVPMKSAPAVPMQSNPAVPMQSSPAVPMQSNPAIPMSANPAPIMAQPKAGSPILNPSPLLPGVPMQQQDPTQIENQSSPMNSATQPIQSQSVPMTTNPPPNQPSSTSTQQNTQPGQPGSTAILPASPTNQ